MICGTAIDFAVNRDGEVVLQKAAQYGQPPDRFEAARGKADVKWRTDDHRAARHPPRFAWRILPRSQAYLILGSIGSVLDDFDRRLPMNGPVQLGRVQHF